MLRPFLAVWLLAIVIAPVRGGVLVPNDPAYTNGNSWYVDTLHMPQAWGYSTGSSSVTIAVLDAGVMADVPDLGGRVLPALTVPGLAPLNGNSNHHGTWVASVAAMTINNNLVGCGVGNFSILPVTVANAQGASSDENVATGIQMAADAGAKVINISLGPFLTYGGLDAAAAAVSSKALVFVSSGNADAYSGLSGYNNLIFVAGTNRTDGRWVEGGYGSTYGPFVNLAAPAEDISVAEPGFAAGYGIASGTSFSAPLAGGAAALAWSINPNLSTDQVRNMLYDTAVDIGPLGVDDYFGHGRIDIGAVAAAAEATLPEPGLLGLVLVGALAALRRRR